MITLGTTFVGSAIAMSGGDKKEKKTPPIVASSSDEENFIKCVVFCLRDIRMGWDTDRWGM